MGMFKIELDLDFDSIIGERHYDDGDEISPNSVEPYRFGEMVVAEIARQLARELTSDAKSELRTIVRDRTRALIDERLAPMVEDALNGDIQLTNAYGEPSGRTTTMRELVVAEVAKHLRKTNARQSYDQTPFDKVLSETTAAALTKDLAAEVAAAKAEIRKNVATSASEVMTAAIVKGLTG